jgi:transcription termination factor NusB
LQPTQWRYINTKLNPTDDASRGLTVDKFLQSRRWIDGPEFLKKPQSEWPEQKDMGVIPDNDAEFKMIVNTMIVNANELNPLINSLISRYSSWSKLKTTIEWILVFKDR